MNKILKKIKTKLTVWKVWTVYSIRLIWSYTEPFRKFLKTWNELITIPIAILLWYYSPYFLRWLDPTAATFDSGILQIIIFAIIAGFILTGISWVYIKMNFPGLYHYIDNYLEEDLWKLQAKYRVGYSLLLFISLFLGFALLVRVVA